jgi:hypothetical protein
VQRKINWVGLAGGVATVTLIAVSLFVPWWQFKIGDPDQAIVEANVSPLNTNFVGVGNSFTIPLIWALNLASVLSLAAGGTAMLIYSVLPAKSYSKRLLGFGYTKPMYSVVFFAISLVALTLLVNGLLGFSVPVVGSSNVQLSESMTQGTRVSFLVSAGFHWPFYLAVVAASLCVAARFYHKRVGIAQVSVTAQ